MPHLLLGQLWSLFLLSVLFALLFSLFWYIRKKFKSKDRKLPLIIILSALAFTSCKKENIEPSIQKPDTKAQLLKQLGFDEKKITFEAKSPIKDTLKFASVEEAILFFKKKKEEKALHIVDIYPLKSKNSLSRASEWDYQEGSDADYIGYVLPGTRPSLAYRGSVNFSHVLGWSGYNVSFQWARNISSGNLESVENYNSAIVGLTVGMGWDHQSGTSTLYPGSAIIRWEVRGIQHYNLFIEGIGTVFSTPVLLYGAYNLNTDTTTFNVD